MSLRANPAASSEVGTQRLRVVAIGTLLVGAALVSGLLTGMLLVNDQLSAIILLAGILAPVLLWRVRSSSIVCFVVAAVLIDQFGSDVPEVLTAKVPLFRSLTETYGLSGAVFLPIEVLMGFALLVWVARAIAERRWSFHASHLGVAVAVFFPVALLADLHGLAVGGVFNIGLWELRPFLYLAVTYFLASQLLGRRGSFQAVLWGMVIGTGVKGILGTQQVIALSSVNPRPQSILEHDESVFFSCFILLTVALWIFRRRGALRRVATALIPFVIIADLGNNRRAAWVMLPAMLLALAVIAYMRAPEHRKVILSVTGVMLILGYSYALAFRNSSALFAEPARAIWSQFQPDARDSSSNIYRDIENANLGIDIGSSPIVGTGFGVLIPHPVPVVDVSSNDPLINFIPHNTILYVWLRMGTVGAVSFWFMIGAAVVSACRLARAKDLDAGLFGTLVLVTVIAWLAQGWLDKGIASLRISILVGCLFGALEAAHRVADWRSGTQEIDAQSTAIRSASNPRRTSNRQTRGIRPSAEPVLTDP